MIWTNSLCRSNNNAHPPRPGRFRLAALLLVAALAGGNNLRAHPGSDCLEGNGVEAQTIRTAAPFTALAVNGAFTVLVACGLPAEIKVTADSNILPHVRTTVANGKLEIGAARSICSKIPVTIKISVPTLNTLTVDGAGDTEVGAIKSDSFAATIDGAVSVRLQGTAKKLTLQAGGSSSVQGAGLLAGEVIAKTSGSASATVQASKSLTAECHDASDLKYGGSPAVKNVQTFDVCDLDAL